MYKYQKLSVKLDDKNLDDKNTKYKNTYHNTIKMKLIDVKSNAYMGTGKENNKKDPKFEVGDHVGISKNKNIFAKGYTPNLFEENFAIKKVENKVPWTNVISDPNGEEITEKFYEKELQERNQTKFKIEKIIKRKSNKLYVKWKGYDNSFNIWVDKKDIIIKNELFSRNAH